MFVMLSQLTTTCPRMSFVASFDVSRLIPCRSYQLAVVNPKINAECNNLQIGDTLCLGLSGQDCSSTYVVKPNDTCDLITSSQSVNATMLWANNPQINADCTNIYVGEVCPGAMYQVSDNTHFSPGSLCR